MLGGMTVAEHTAAGSRPAARVAGGGPAATAGLRIRQRAVAGGRLRSAHPLHPLTPLGGTR